MQRAEEPMSLELAVAQALLGMSTQIVDCKNALRRVTQQNLLSINFDTQCLSPWYIAQRRDFPIIQGGLLITACVFVFVNILVDMAYAWFDPRGRDDR